MKATEKASESALVPRKAALVISRRRPRTRETSVRRDRTEPWRIRAMPRFSEEASGFSLRLSPLSFLF
jgi:hypothetical protein